MINKLLREISLETSILSFIIQDHPKLEEIIAIGNDAIPVLLDHLRDHLKAVATNYEKCDFHDFSPWYALLALGRITQVNPIKPEHAGRLTAIIQDWLVWSENPDTLPKIEEQARPNLFYWPPDDNDDYDDDDDLDDD